MPLSQSQPLQNGTPWHDTKRFVCSILGCWANLRPPKWKFLPVGRASVRLLPMGSILCLDPILDPLLSRKCLPAFESCLCFRIITLFSTYSPCTGAGRFLQYSRNMLECWISWLHKTVWVRVLKDVQRNAWKNSWERKDVHTMSIHSASIESLEKLPGCLRFCSFSHGAQAIQGRSAFDKKQRRASCILISCICWG